jgi:hypothetical protein
VLALAVDHQVTVYTKASTHVPKVFPEGEGKAEKVKATDLLAVSRADVLDALNPEPVIAEDAGAREIRETNLHEMSAAEVRDIAKALDVEQNTKAENIDAILNVEFP